MAIISLLLGDAEDGTKRFVFVMWTVAPPIWFFIEYWLLTPEEDKNDSGKMARLKLAQEVASRVWASVTAVLVVLYFKPH